MIFDLHNDFPTAIDNRAYSKYLQECGEATVTAVIWTSAFETDALAVVTDITAELEALENVPIAIEDMGFAEERGAYETLDFSKYLYCSLTWNYNNAFAGGALDDGTLTRKGARAIELINKSGCAVDLAHLNRKSFFAVLDKCEIVLCSHTGFNAHPRSIDDEMIRALIARHALIGLCAVTAFTGARGAEAFADVIDRFVQRYGAECLALGTDFMGSNDIPKDISTYPEMVAAVRSLSKRGYGKEDINNILYGNARSFYDRRSKT